MAAKTEDCKLNSELTLRDHSLSPLTVRAVDLALTKQDDKIIECRLTFQVNPELYQHIDKEVLFNLKQEVREPLSAGDFQSESDIKIEASLKPDLLTHLTERAADVNEAATYILSLNQEQPDNPLLSTENWFGLSVKQPTESGETGYRTFWAYVNPSVFAQAATSSKEISEAIIDFFKKWTEANLPAATQEATSEIVEGITNFFKELADISLDGLSQEVEAGFKPTTKSGQIFEEIVNFFKEDNWPFVQIEGKPVLQMAFQGENGKWTCNASARVEQEQFLFYSIYPVNAPENKRLAIAEFLTRANSGMSIGNFELDFADGEIRYKTSIDVEGDRLSSSSIKKLVYTNVIMMDQYLPGIMSVIYSNVSPEDAIAQIELAPSPPQPSTTPSQPNPSEPPEKESHILSLLTREEISQFHQAIQLQHSPQKKAAQPLLTKLKQELTTRLGTLGESVFNQAYTLFETRQFDIKNLKLIQRYVGLAARIQLLRENLPKESHLFAQAKEIENLSDIIDERLEKLATTEFLGKSEIEMLIEIEEIRSQLAAWEQQHRPAT